MICNKECLTLLATSGDSQGHVLLVLVAETPQPLSQKESGHQNVKNVLLT